MPAKEKEKTAEVIPVQEIEPVQVMTPAEESFKAQAAEIKALRRTISKQRTDLEECQNTIDHLLEALKEREEAIEKVRDKAAAIVSVLKQQVVALNGTFVVCEQQLKGV